MPEMIFLPVAERELRVAARKRSTFSVRIGAAMIALLIGCIVYLFGTFSWGRNVVNSGSTLFSVLAGMGFILTLSAGLFLTSDCLSEEKREGTLGFLFLTELGGYDVVSGKLFATSLRASYALLAIFPIIAVSLLMGGVSGGQFWRTCVVLISTMFVSLAAGLFISSISRDSQKAMAATLLLLFFILGGGPACDALLAAMYHRGFEPAFSALSPVFFFEQADGKLFWRCLLVNQTEGWLFFGLAAFLLPRIWQEKERLIRNGDGGVRTRNPKIIAGRRLRRRKLLDSNPVLWIASRGRGQTILHWTMAGLFLGSLGVFAVFDGPMNWMLWNHLAGIFPLALYLGFSSQAVRFILEARRNGLIELFLIAPLTVAEIVQGQWRALIRMFGIPLALYLAAQMGGQFMTRMSTSSALSGPPASTPTTNSAASMPSSANGTNGISPTRTYSSASGWGAAAGAAGLVVPVAASLAGAVTLVGNLAALAWFGMWTGLNGRNIGTVTFKTMVYVLVIPWIGIGFAATAAISLWMLNGSIFSGSSWASPVWIQLITIGIMTVFSVCKNAAFILWASRRLNTDFRLRASLASASSMAN